PAELRYHLSAGLAELYLDSTSTVERALPHLGEAIGLAHQLGLGAELQHLQELQQLFALRYHRIKERPDALRFQPVEEYRGLLSSQPRAVLPARDRVWVLDTGGAASYD